MKHVFPKSLEEEKTYLYPFSLFHKNGVKTGETREARQLFLQTSHKLFHPFGSGKALVILLGAALALHGLQNLIVAIFTVYDAKKRP